MRLSDRDRTNGMPITSIREIALLRSLRHPNIISVLDVAVGKDMADVYMVMEYAEQVGSHPELLFDGELGEGSEEGELWSAHGGK